MELLKWLQFYFTTGIDWNSNTATNENWWDDDTLGWERCRTIPLTAARGPTGKVHPWTGHEGPEGEQRYSPLSLTAALDWGRWSTPRPGRFPPGKTRYPLYGRLGGPQGQSGGVRKISRPPGFDPRTVQSVASRYTDCAIPFATSKEP